MLTINSVLVTIIAVEVFIVMGLWHVTTRGAWRYWPAGRSLMGLLACLAGITTVSSIARLMPGWQAESSLYTVGYLGTALAVASIATTIITAQRGRQAGMDAAHDAADAEAGSH